MAYAYQFLFLSSLREGSLRAENTRSKPFLQRRESMKVIDMVRPASIPAKRDLEEQQFRFYRIIITQTLLALGP
jgi:hypothetical protein